jgi:hypothetical protein
MTTEAQMNEKPARQVIAEAIDYSDLTGLPYREVRDQAVDFIFEALAKYGYEIAPTTEIKSLRMAVADACEIMDTFADEGSQEGREDYPDGTAVTLICGRSTSYLLTIGDFRRACEWAKNHDR